MKILKLSILAFAMAACIVSCGNGNASATKSDTTAATATGSTVSSAAPKKDTPTAPPAKPDTSTVKH